jgi:hypothetical protein
MVPPITPEFILVAIAVGVGSVLGTYLAGRHNRSVASEFDETELEGTDVDGSQLTFEDAYESIKARDAALETIADNNASWLKRAVEEMARLDHGIQDTGEGFRKRLLERGLRPPVHANAWGSLFMTLTKRKVLVPTGEYRPMREAKSHGRRTPVYALVHGQAA